MRLNEARSRGLLPEKEAKLVLGRFDAAVSGINRVEKASGMQYPAAYIEPAAIITQPDAASHQYGILFARTIPVDAAGSLRIVVQISAPLVAYGLKGTIHAILAHEFLHYLELLYRASKMQMVSDEVTGSVFESAHADTGRLFEPGAVFSDRTLLRHITKRFPAGFRDYKLEDKTIQSWIGRGLAKQSVPLGSNTAKIPAETLARLQLSPAMADKLESIAQKSARIIRRASTG